MAYTFSESRKEVGQVAEKAVADWMKSANVKHTWLNEEEDKKLTYDIIANDTGGIEHKIDVKRTYETQFNKIHIKIGNGAVDENGSFKLNAGLFYFGNEADTYFFVDNQKCMDAWQVSSATLKKIILEGKYVVLQQYNCDDTVWAFVNMDFIPEDKKIYYLLNF